MLTLCIHYTLDPNNVAPFAAYAEAEQGPIRRCGGSTLGYFLPTDFSGPTNEAYGLIEFSSLAAYEIYRHALSADPEHRRNVAELERSGAILRVSRSILIRARDASVEPKAS